MTYQNGKSFLKWNRSIYSYSSILNHLALRKTVFLHPHSYNMWTPEALILLWLRVRMHSTNDIFYSIWILCEIFKAWKTQYHSREETVYLEMGQCNILTLKVIYEAYFDVRKSAFSKLLSFIATVCRTCFIWNNILCFEQFFRILNIFLEKVSRIFWIKQDQMNLDLWPRENAI